MPAPALRTGIIVALLEIYLAVVSPRLFAMLACKVKPG